MSDPARALPSPGDVPCPGCGASPVVVVCDGSPEVLFHGSFAAQVEQWGRCARCGLRIVRTGRVRRFTPWRRRRAG